MNLKYLLFALGFFISVEIMPAMDGGLKNYQCSKCATVVKSDHTPSSLYCRASGGSHQWNNLGEVGMEVYSCKKCGTWLESKRTPSSLGCPAKGSPNGTIWVVRATIPINAENVVLPSTTNVHLHHWAVPMAVRTSGVK